MNGMDFDPPKPEVALPGNPARVKAGPEHEKRPDGEDPDAKHNPPRHGDVSGGWPTIGSGSGC